MIREYLLYQQKAQIIKIELLSQLIYQPENMTFRNDEIDKKVQSMNPHLIIIMMKTVQKKKQLKRTIDAVDSATKSSTHLSDNKCIMHGPAMY